ncbi:uncharacterized protein N7443_008170 [Penicillium atrosanguineum]|uniref:uncharacterized protein n=1 Tax=Penicillium atrosanguineum TaxID=1132637 RepID=UPI0023A477FF|nr:uncharacterized protein N7443_008170 [Penicillium atrosanguineum]KAJ5297277.1 hypothetical protein N7443_008170 [Penicillium atrosanguineum]
MSKGGSGLCLQPDTDHGPRNGSSTSWLEQGLARPIYQGGPFLGADLGDLVGQFSGINESGVVANFNGWDANLQPFSPNLFSSLAATVAPNTGLISTAPSTIDGGHDSDEIEDNRDPADAISSQLTSLGQRARRATRRLVLPDRTPLTVSSPEVNEALEDTNTLIRIMNKITASDCADITLHPTTTDYSLAFSALACHQHLVALFRAICDSIDRCLQSQKEPRQRHHRTGQSRDVGPSSVAQFVMVLQLLMHLINRIDRSLFQSNPSMRHGKSGPTGNHLAPVTPNTANYNTPDPTRLEAAAGSSVPPGGLLVLVKDIVETIPNEHEKLRQVIQKLQTEMEHSELH